MNPSNEQFNRWIGHSLGWFLVCCLFLGLPLALVEQRPLVFSMPLETKRVPIGPITPDKDFEQRIVLPDTLARKRMGFALRLATYDRPNLGQLEVRLIQGERRFTYNLRASKIKDNALAYFPIEEGFAPGEATLKLSGMNNHESTAPTAWAREPVTGYALLENGAATGQELSVDFYMRESSWHSLVHQVKSPGIAVTLAGLLALPPAGLLGLITALRRKERG